MGVKMWYRLRYDGVRDGENAVCSKSGHRRSRDGLGPVCYLCHCFRRSHQKMLHMVGRDHEGMSEKDRRMVEEHRRLCSNLDDERVVGIADQVAERAEHG